MKLTNKIRGTMAFLASISLLAPTTTLAQSSRFTSQAYSLLNQTAYSLGLGNYSMSHDPYVNSLGNGSYYSLTLNLTGGWNYAILGVCDEDCTDLDLTLYDENGNMIDSDTAYDDTPLVTITPQWTGQFTIKVEMPTCYVAPCYYGVGVFVR